MRVYIVYKRVNGNFRRHNNRHDTSPTNDVSRIGKFKISDNETQFSISYRYTFSDLIGSIWYLLMLFLGRLILFSYCKTYSIDRLYGFSDWLLGLLGLFIFSFGAYLLAAGLYNPSSGFFRIDKIKQEVKIVDFLKSETIPINNITSIYHEIRTSYKPKMKYAMLCLRLSNGDKKECFIVRSNIPIDLGRKVEKDLKIVSRQLRDAINNAIKLKDERKKTTANCRLTQWRVKWLIEHYTSHQLLYWADSAGAGLRIENQRS